MTRKDKKGGFEGEALNDEDEASERHNPPFFYSAPYLSFYIHLKVQTAKKQLCF